MSNFDNFEKPSFYAVLPAYVRYANSLPANARLLFGEISALSNKEGFCWASNNYFAALYEVDPSAVSKWIKCLADAGFIRLEYSFNNYGVKSRKIFLKDAPAQPPKSPVAAASKPTPPADPEPPPSVAPEGGIDMRQYPSEPIHQGIDFPQGGIDLFQGGIEKNADIILQANNTANNIYITSSAASSSSPPPPEPQKIKTPDAAEAAAKLKAVLKSIHKELVFSPDFYPKAARFIADNNLDAGYPQWLFLYCKRLQPKSLTGFYYKVFSDPRFAELYVSKSDVPNTPPKTLPCPACGALRQPFDNCPQCGLPANHRDDQNLISRHRRIAQMPQNVREQYE
ncbi:MAG: helix-turn-helix domain-containing protein, partial [Spirochaetaceae bacterium]|nr:helix-turn-helix domain-containing protein [Spirochaetaceae bacterium]